MTTRFFSFSELTEYRQIASIDEIGRRYLAMNAFDGILTMIGLVMGSFIGGIDNPRLITFTGLATCLAMGVSGFWGAYMTEAAERKNDLRELEHAMLRDLGKTKQARAFRFAVVIVSLIDGLSPVISGATVLIPFFFRIADRNKITAQTCGDACRTGNQMRIFFIRNRFAPGINPQDRYQPMCMRL